MIIYPRGRDASSHKIWYRVIGIFPKLKMAATAILDLLGGAMGPPTKAHSLCVLPLKMSSWSANLLSSFQVIRVWIFCRSGLQVLFHAPKISFFFWGGGLPPKFRGTSFRHQKGTSLRDFTSYELSRVKIHPPVWPVSWSKKKGINKNIKKFVIFHPFAQYLPVNRFLPNLV